MRFINRGEMGDAMKNRQEKPHESKSLRQKAEERLKNRKAANTIGSGVDVQLLFHELQLKQIELEIQEEELNHVLENAISATELARLKLAEEALSKSESRFKAMFDNSTVAIYETDAEGRCLLVNKQWCNFAGISAKQAQGYGWHEAIHPDDRERIFKLWDDYVKSNKTWNFEYRFCTPNQKITWVLGTAIPLRNEQGEITGYLGMNTDITERMAMEDTLRLSKNYYRYLVRNLPNISVFLYDHDLRFILAEGHLHPDFEFTTNEIEGKTIWEVLPADKIEVFEALCRQTLGGNQTENYISKYKDRTYLVNMLPVKKEQGEIIAGMVVSLDITEIKRIEEELQWNYTLLHTAGETAKFGGWILDLSNNRVFMTDQVAAIHDLPVGSSVTLEEGIAFYAPEWRETIARCVEECSKKGISYDRELEIITAKGKRIWVRTSGKAIRNEKGEIVKLQGSFQDINETKLAETALLKSEEKWRKLVYTIPDYVALYDREGKYLFLNHFAEGFGPGDIEGKTYLDFISGESKPIFVKMFDQASKTGDTQYFQYKAIGDNYSMRDYENYFVPIFEDNQFVNMLVIARDITERKKTEQSLLESEAQLQELNATKDKFFSIIAHDLKNPFNSIMGFSSILSEEANTLEKSKISEYSAVIQRSSKRAMDLLTNLLDWARSQTGRMKFSPEQLELRLLVDRETDLLKDAAYLKNISINNRIDEDTMIIADKSMIGAVMRNLVSNAIKFTQSGGKVIISAKLKPDELEMAVADNGIGINKESLERVFRIEENLTTAGTLNEKGTGLGLILCKEFIEKHGGKIWVESEVGEGSTFRFSIPVY